MAVFKDPTGALLSLWQPKEHLGADVVGATGSACWVELATRDTAAAKTFYTGLFGWNFKDSQSEFMAYTEWINGAQPIGGMIAQDGPQWEGVPPHWLIYFTVEDADATAALTQEMGGQVIVPAMDIPGTGRFTVLADPQGAVFAVIKMTMPMP